MAKSSHARKTGNTTFVKKSFAIESNNPVYGHYQIPCGDKEPPHNNNAANQTANDKV